MEGGACQAGQAGREGGEIFRCRTPRGKRTERLYEYRNRMFVHVSPIPPRGSRKSADLSPLVRILRQRRHNRRASRRREHGTDGFVYGLLASLWSLRRSGCYNPRFVAVAAFRPGRRGDSMPVPPVPSTLPARHLLLVVGWCMLAVGTVRARADDVEEGFEGRQPLWSLAEADCGPRVTGHALTGDAAHRGNFGERIVLDAAAGSSWGTEGVATIVESSMIAAMPIF